MNQPRQPKGIPVGGQYAAQHHGESSVALRDQHYADWGDVTVREGATTPWGKADIVEPLGPGAVMVSTPSHGGVKLSPERSVAIPKPLRNSNGWYEEDAEVAIVGMYHPDLFADRGGPSRERFESEVRQWFPDRYEAATGQTIPTGESSVKDQQTWREAHAAQWQGVGAVPSEDHPGYLDVAVSPVPTARQYGSERRVVRVPADRYEQGRIDNALVKYPGAFLISDPTDGTYEDITPPPPPPAKRYHGIDLSGLTPRQSALARRDLQQRWRNPETGEVRTLAAIVEGDGLTEKTVMVEGGKRQFVLIPGDGRGYPVSKATWSAVEAPDRRTPTSRITGDIRVAEARLERQRETNDREGADRTARKLEELRAALAMQRATDRVDA